LAVNTYHNSMLYFENNDFFQVRLMKKNRGRIINLLDLLDKKSFFLFGPRATGKSTLIRTQLAPLGAVVIDLLGLRTFREFLARPEQLEEYVDAHMSTERPIVVIDEIQKIPELLNEVHRLIEKRNWRFLLTGSSARSLRSKGVNLLAGRAWTAELFPLTQPELGDTNLEKRLRFGTLPAVYDSKYPEEELDAYVATYLKEEILAEGVARNLGAFSDFLKVAGLSQSKVMNMNKLSQELGISQPTVRSYYQILQDTFLGTLLPPWAYSKKRKSIAHAKFYLFDLGVMHAMTATNSLDRNSSQYGDAFESYMICEVRAYISYRRVREQLYFWRSTKGDEVDLIIGKKIAFEFKATKKVQQDDLDGLRTLAEEGLISSFILVSEDKFETVAQGIRRIHWQTFLSELWSDKLLN